MIALIWVAKAQQRKRLYLQCLHRCRIFGRSFMVMAGQMKEAVDQQVRSVIGQPNAALGCLARAGFMRQCDVAEELGRPFLR